MDWESQSGVIGCERSDCKKMGTKSDVISRVGKLGRASGLTKILLKCSTISIRPLIDLQLGMMDILSGLHDAWLVTVVYTNSKLSNKCN